MSILGSLNKNIFGFNSLSSRREAMFEAMKGLEKTLDTYTQFEAMNKLANSISEMAETYDDLHYLILHLSPERMTAMHVINQIRTDKSGVMQSHSSWKAIEPKLDEIIAASNLRKDEGSKIFLSMLRAMCLGRPDLSGAKPIHVTFAGGGAKGFAHIGVLKEIEEQGLYDNLEWVSGTSSGGLIAGMAAIGYRPTEIEDIVHQKDFSGFIYEFKSLLGKLAFITSPIHGGFQLLRNIAFLDKFSEHLKPMLAEHVFDNKLFKHFSNNSHDQLEQARLKGKVAFHEKFLEMIAQPAKNNEMVSLIARISPNWSKDAVEKCTELAEAQLGVHIHKNKFDLLTKLNHRNIWLGMAPFMRFENANDALMTGMNIMTRQDTVKAFIERLIFEKVKVLHDKCVNDPDPGVYKKFVRVFEPGNLDLELPRDVRSTVLDKQMARITLSQLDALRKQFPREGFKKLMLNFCEKKGTILKKSNTVAVSVHGNHPTYGNMPVVDAMCATMRLPLIFSPYVINKPDPLPGAAREGGRTVTLVDGGLLHNFPITSLEKMPGIDRQQVMGCYLAPRSNYLAAQSAEELSNPKRATVIPGQTALRYFIRNQVARISRMSEQIHGDKQVSKYQAEDSQMVRVAAINTYDYDTVDFQINSSQKAELIDSGQSTARKLLSQEQKGRAYDINTAFYAEKFMEQLDQMYNLDQAGLRTDPVIKTKLRNIEDKAFMNGFIHQDGLSM